MSNRFDFAKQALAENVRKRRKAKRLSQESLAFEAQIDRTYISQIEREIGNPSLLIICRIADVLDCEVNQLIGACSCSQM